MITTIYDRARRCTYCNISIPKGEGHIRFEYYAYSRFEYYAYRGSCVINICAECIEKALNEIGKKELRAIKKRNAKIRVLDKLK